MHPAEVGQIAERPACARASSHALLPHAVVRCALAAQQAAALLTTSDRRCAAAAQQAAAGASSRCSAPGPGSLLACFPARHHLPARRSAGRRQHG